MSTFAQLLQAVGYELAVTDRWCRLLMPDEQRDRLVDKVDRRFPAHLESDRTPGYWEGG